MSMSEAFRAVKRFGRPIKPFLRWLGSSSYSQWGEDLILFEAMKPSKRGFYVDCGAYDPIEDSNTYKLYKRGWSGITIEPNLDARWKFRMMRGRDTHLAVGASTAPSTLNYHRFQIGVLNTMSDERAAGLIEAGYESRGVERVRCDRLDTLLEEYAGGRHIDMLSVDCEGDDLGVVGTLDFVKWRPTVVMVEDLAGYYTQGEGEISRVVQFMRDKGYEPVSRPSYTVIFVARDWRELNRRSGAYREEAIYPNILPEPDAAPATPAAEAANA